VYDLLAHRSAQAIRAGAAAVVDAVYAHGADREAIERVAAEAQLPFVGVWLDAPETVLIDRIEQRRLDVSDADAAVIKRQLAEGPGTIAWSRIDAAAAAGTVLSHVIAVLRERLQGDVVRSGPEVA
jgi:predicted kinase